MNNLKNKSLLSAALILLPLAGMADAEFLMVEPSAKALGMGGAFAASSNSPANLRYNPAGLASLKNTSISLSHQDAYGEWAHEWAALATSVDSTAYAVEYSSSSMKAFELYDQNEKSLGSANAGSQSLGLAMARKMLGFDAGASVHAFRSQLLEFNSTGYSLDFGLRYEIKGAGLSLALAGQNFGEMTSYDAGHETLPTLMRGGLSWERALAREIALSVNADAVRFLGNSAQNELRAGARLSLFSSLSLSAGIQQGAAVTQPTLGIGAQLGRFEVSYAFLPGSALGNTQLISIELKL